MPTFRFGGKNGKRYSLAASDEHLVVRTRSRAPVTGRQAFEVAPLSNEARAILAQFTLQARFREAGVEVLQAAATRGSRALRDKARAVLSQQEEIEFAGRVLVDPRTRVPAIYTENFFVKFGNDEAPSACRKTLKDYKLEVKRELPFARNAFFVGAAEGTGMAVFDIAEKLLNEKSVELCHPELIRERRQRAAFAQQWHLKPATINGTLVTAHANVEAAWALSDGSGAVIAIIDDGVDMDHEEFRGSSKIVAPRDVTLGTNNPRPGPGDNHGTACAGVACGNGLFKASGVAPKARLMPIRYASALGSIEEAEAFFWAAQNGADVISCSWGPLDGDPDDPNDPLHHHVEPLPDSTRTAIDFAVRNGRNGKGCVVLFAAGNGNESVENDGYASYDKVIAVAACNDRGQKSSYSDFGASVWCAFPSNHGEPSLTPGIWTTDRSGGSGYNHGHSALGDVAGDYTNRFGGTSSACPGAAGVAALIISRNPSLTSEEVRQIMRNCCDRIDVANGNYDAGGRSPIYGYGRLNARRAVELAVPPQPTPITIFRAVQDVPIRDFRTSRLEVTVPARPAIASIKISVDIEHTYIGDLVVKIKPPAGLNIKAITLHNRAGGGMDNLVKTYDAITTPSLGALIGKSPAGTWGLSVTDEERRDTGKIRSFTLELGN